MSQKKTILIFVGFNLLMLHLRSESNDQNKHNRERNLLKNGTQETTQQSFITNKRTSNSKLANETGEQVLNKLAKYLKIENKTVLSFPADVKKKNNYQTSSHEEENSTKLFAERKDAINEAVPSLESNVSVRKNGLLNETKGSLKEHIFDKEGMQKLNCSEFGPLKSNATENEVNNFCYSPTDSLTCYQDPIFCKVYHMSGKRELDWPVYGEYSYLPHKHWVKILQHGGVVFLYHPCANQSSVAKLRSLAEACMHRFVLTPYKKLTWEKPLAMVSWGCYLLMKNVNLTRGKEWIKSHAFKGPASHVHKNGKFETRLVKPAKVVTDVKDTFLCPDEQEKASFSTAAPPPPKPEPTASRHAVEDLILKRLAKVKHIKKPHRDKNITQVSVNTKKAFSAFSSLVFLCVLLALLLLYTKLWRPSAQGKGRYERVHENDTLPRYDARTDQFSLLKSSQDFIKSIRRTKRDRKLDSLSTVKLLAPINEEDDEFETIY